MKLSRLLWLNLALFSLLIVATRSSLVLHEVLGHGAAHLAFGGTDPWFGFSLLGGGWMDGVTDVPFSATQQVLFSLAGIVVNLVTGSAAWLLAGKIKRPLVKTGALLFGGLALTKAFAYTALGIYYGIGDPAAATLLSYEELAEVRWLWSLALPLVGLSVYWLTRDYLRVLEEFVPLTTLGARVRWSLATMGVVVLAYAGARAATEDPDQGFSTARTSIDRQSENEAAWEKARLEEARQAQSAPVTSGAGAPVEAEPFPSVSPSEVEDRRPGREGGLLLLLTAGLSWLLALIRFAPNSEVELRDVDWRWCLATVPWAGAALLLILGLRSQ